MRQLRILFIMCLVAVAASCGPQPPEDVPSPGEPVVEPVPEEPSAPEMPTGEAFANAIGMAFVRVPSGSFRMGYEEGVTEAEMPVLPESISGGRADRLTGDFDEHPAHEVTMSRAFYLGAREVTNAEYEQFDPDHAALRGKLGFSTEDDEAVVFVSWHDARRFCEWLSEKEGLPYRLPTEAEWEYACRAGTTTAFHTGATLPEQFHNNVQSDCWYPDHERVPSGRQFEDDIVPVIVGTTPPNAWGLFDMHGNVEEWCHDWYGPYADKPQTDPVGYADGDFKVTRGGSHSTELYYLRSANRLGTLPEDTSWLIGFRVALGELPDTAPLGVPPAPLNQQNVSQSVPADVTEGPDPATPYFRGPVQYMKIPADSMGPMFSRHNHDPAIVECPNGDLLAIWYTCVREPGRELGLVASRLPYGTQDWQPASPFWDVPDRNDHAPAAWFDGENTLYQFVGLSAAATWGNLATIMRTSMDNGATWSKARIIAPEHGLRHQCVESVFRMENGTIVLPNDASSRGSGGTALLVSSDNGETWSDPGGTIAGIHAGAVELSDGRLMAFGRGDNIDDHMPKSISSDGGVTWSYTASAFPPVGGGQRLVLLRLKEGPILLGSFADAIEAVDGTGNLNRCSGLFVTLSFDDGETWPVKRLVTPGGEAREWQRMDGGTFTLSNTSAEPKGYMSVCQGLDGVIHLISSWNHYAFNLAWIQEGWS